MSYENRSDRQRPKWSQFVAPLLIDRDQDSFGELAQDPRGESDGDRCPLSAPHRGLAHPLRAPVQTTNWLRHARPAACRLHRRKHEFLRVLDGPEIPLNTYGSENDIRACVIKRKISGGTVSASGRDARDVLLGLINACMKLDVSFFRYLGDRLAIAAEAPIPPLPDLITQAAKA